MSYYHTPDYLHRQQVIHVPANYPKCQDWKRDIVCYDSGKLRSLAHTGIFPKGNGYLKERGVRFSFLLMYCLASSQNYHILVYGTNLGLMRVNIYYDQGKLAVTEHKILDSALVINQNLGSRY